MARPERIGASQSAVNYRGLRDWIDQVEKLGELQKVVQEGLSEEEVQRSKNKIESATVLQGESTLGRMRGLASRWTYNREYRSLEEDLAKLESITRDDLVAVAASNAFKPMTITTLGPGAA